MTLETAMDSLRMSMESLLAEMEGLWKKPLSMEEKTYAPRADVAVWQKAKNRVHNAIPKVKEFIHRSVWAMGSPERKRLESVYADHIQPRIPFLHVDEILKLLEDLRKDRQVLASLGKNVYQECKGICSELQSAVRSLHDNAAKGRRKKDAESKRHFR
ncbi:MAG: hypothetical protein FJ303_05490 [Planctomycetes bacterium]|nr:hypothetical protein [Planctomycetota bacterium]